MNIFLLTCLDLYFRTYKNICFTYKINQFSKKQLQFKLGLFCRTVVQFFSSILGSNNVQADKHTHFFFISVLLIGNYTGDGKLLKFLMGTFMWNHQGTTVRVGNAITHHYHRSLMAVAQLHS